METGAGRGRKRVGEEGKTVGEMGEIEMGERSKVEKYEEGKGRESGIDEEERWRKGYKSRNGKGGMGKAGMAGRKRRLGERRVGRGRGKGKRKG